MSRRPPPITRHAVIAPAEDRGERLAGARLLPIELVEPNPWQPRQHADPDRLGELTADVAARGVLEPLIVRPFGNGRFQVVAGERRYRAARAAGLTTVPAIIKEDLSEDDAREISLVENLLREDLDIEDEARFLRALYEQKGSLRATGEAIHKSYQYVNRRIKLLDDPRILLAYREGRLKLDDLIAGQAALTDDTPLDDESGAVTERNNYGGRMEEVRFFRTRSAFKPFQKLQLHVRRLEPSAIPPEERPRLREAVHDLIAELTALEQELDSADLPPGA